jgi:hypothetical protein
MGMLEGKIVPVTCGNSGIGPAAATRFASELIWPGPTLQFFASRLNYWRRMC